MRKRVVVLLAVLVLLGVHGCAPQLSPEPVPPDGATDAPSPTRVPRATALTVSSPVSGQAIIIDHTTADVNRIPAQWLEQAKRTVVWVYGSTSHGTQVWMGADYLDQRVDEQAYAFCREWRAIPAQGEGLCLRMAYDDSWSWDPDSFLDAARGLLDDAPEATAFYVVMVRRDVG